MFKIEDYMESLFVDAVAIEFSAIVTNSMDDHVRVTYWLLKFALTPVGT